MRESKRIIGFISAPSPILILVVAVFGLASCANPQISGGDRAQLNHEIDNALDAICDVPTIAGNPPDTLRILRGQLVLASIAGYANRSISSYAVGDDVQSDGLLVLQRLQKAETELSKAADAAKNGNHLFPLYRADLIIAEGAAAEAALRPTIRAGQATLSSAAIATTDGLKRAGTMLLNLLQDEVYREALQESCRNLNKQLGAQEINGKWILASPPPDNKLVDARHDTDERLTYRCAQLKQTIGTAAANISCP